MKINSIGFSAKVWLTTIFAAPILVWFYVLVHMLLTNNFKGDFDAAIAWTFSITLYALLFSMPSFLIFSTTNHFITKSNMAVIFQKLIMVVVVTILILGTVFIYLFVTNDMRSRLTGLLVAFPCWLLAIITISIYKTNPKLQIKNNDVGKLK